MPVIMVIEDEELLLQAISEKLKLAGIDVVSCTSGKQAIDYLTNLPKLPNAIWLDYYLKDTNGVEFMRVIKGNNRWKDIPVIVVSNSASPEKVKTMLALGAKKYILKAEHKLSDIIDSFEEFIVTENKTH